MTRRQVAVLCMLGGGLLAGCTVHGPTVRVPLVNYGLQSGEVRICGVKVAR